MSTFSDKNASSSPDTIADDQRESVDCMFCGVSDSELYACAKSRYDERRFDVVRCRRCGLVYTNPRIAHKATEIENRPSNPTLFTDASRLRWKRSAADLQVRRIERFCPPGRLLDFGCGQGILVHRAVQRGWDAYGTELNRNLVTQANEHWGDTRLWCDSLETILERNRAGFDALISTQVFEHLTNPLEMLRELGALLKPGGFALIDVPNLDCAEERRRHGASLDPTAHLYYFTRATLTRMMREAGFTVMTCRAAPNNLGLYRRVFERLFGPALPVILANLTESLPLPGIGKGVFAVGRWPGPTC